MEIMFLLYFILNKFKLYTWDNCILIMSIKISVIKFISKTYFQIIFIMLYLKKNIIFYFRIVQCVNNVIICLTISINEVCLKTIFIKTTNIETIGLFEEINMY